MNKGKRKKRPKLCERKVAGNGRARRIGKAALEACPHLASQFT